MILRRGLLFGGSAFAAALSILVVFGPSSFGAATQASQGGMDAMSIDMDWTGNSSSAVGTIQQCARLQKDGILNFDEDGVADQMIIDVTAKGIAAYSDNGTPADPSDDSGGITGYQYTLNYPSKLTVAAQEATNSAVNVLAANNADPANSIMKASEPLPDDEATNYNTWDSAVLDYGTEAPESGDGVLDRLSISADTGVPAGQYLITLSANGNVDASGASFAPVSTGVANIAVNQACGAAVTSYGYYHPVTPKRILDTRPAPFGPIGVPAAGKVGAGDGAAITVDVTNTYTSGVPASGVTAVVINTTVTGPTEASHLTVFPSDVGPPNAANLNFLGGETRPNLVTVKVGPDGNVKIRNNSGQTDVIMDIQGWYGTPAAGSRYNPITPKRILDTRPAPYGPIGVDQNGVLIPAVKIGPGGVLTVDVTNTYASGVPDSVVTAVIVNVTVTEPTAPSHLTVYPSDAAAAPNAANLNFVGGQTVPNLVTVKVGPSGGGSVKVRNNSGSTHVIFDIVGWYGASSGDVFTPLPPKRILETRGAPYGPIGVPAAGKMGSGDGAVLSVDVTNTQGSGVPDPPAVSAVIVNTTVTEPTAPSHLTVYPSDVPPPNAANLNFVAGQTVPNLVVVKIGGDGKVNIRNQSGFTHVIFDVAGYFAPAP